MAMTTAVMFIDGGCRPTNPGHAAFAAVISLDRPKLNGPSVSEHVISRYIGWASNNVAELTALIVGTKYAGYLGAERLEVFSDSKLVVEQTHGRWRLRSDELRPLVLEARELLFKHFPGAWELTWVPREKNMAADRYCGQAIQAGRHANPWLRKFLKDNSPGKIIDPFARTRDQGSGRA